MNDIELKLKQIESMSKMLSQEGEKLGEEIRQFQNQIAKINPPFSKELQIGEKEWIVWDAKQKCLSYQTDKIVIQLSSADVPVRRKSITYFSAFLDAIIEGYAQCMEGKQKKAQKVVESPIQDDEEEVLPVISKPKKIKRKKTRKVKRARKTKVETVQDADQ